MSNWLVYYRHVADAELTLEELAERSGVQPRVIRSYIEQDLLRGPASKGRYARYGDYHLERLLAIRALREQGLSLAEIRLRLLTMSDEQIARTGAAAAASGPASALEYLRRVALETPVPVAVAPPRLAAMRDSGPLGRAPEETTSFERLLFSLQEALADRRVDRQARGEPWYRIEVTPEIELHVRGAFSPEAVVTLERLADYLREIALGGMGPPAPT